MEKDKEKLTLYGCIVCGKHEVVKQCDYCHNWACVEHITSLTTGDICDKCAGAKKA